MDEYQDFTEEELSLIAYAIDQLRSKSPEDKVNEGIDEHIESVLESIAEKVARFAII